MASVDEPDPLMPIGMFSRASLVSVKALRNYHELGLLVPDSIDAATGYRSYRVSQLADAAVVKRLRDLDVPLRDIAEVVRARDPEVTRKVIAEHAAEMERRLRDVAAIVEELQSALERPGLHTPVHVRLEPAVHALARTGSVDGNDYASFLGPAYADLFRAVEASGVVPAGPPAALYPAEVGATGEPVVAYLPIAGPIALPEAVVATNVVLSIVPEATCAVVTHAGGYDTAGHTYRQLGAWVAHHAESLHQPVREHYVVSVDPATGTLLPDDELRTEISWPIRPTPDSGVPTTKGTTS